MDALEAHRIAHAEAVVTAQKPARCDAWSQPRTWIKGSKDDGELLVFADSLRNHLYPYIQDGIYAAVTPHAGGRYHFEGQCSKPDAKRAQMNRGKALRSFAEAEREARAFVEQAYAFLGDLTLGEPLLSKDQAADAAFRLSQRLEDSAWGREAKRTAAKQALVVLAQLRAAHDEGATTQLPRLNLEARRLLGEAGQPLSTTQEAEAWVRLAQAVLTNDAPCAEPQEAEGAQGIDPEGVLHRTVITVEVLSKGPFHFTDLSEVHEAITSGPCSGDWKTMSQVVGKARMRRLLEAQGSAPEFLVEE